ncbi:MAG: AAA family ATPase, partial [Phycisphaerales bacterium]
MTPRALSSYLTTILSHDLRLSLMIWGPPGIGKSSIVSQAADSAGLEFIDVRLSQLAPTDLRGLPVPERLDDGGGIARWYPPEFLPRGGRGVLFLDELNMAAPTMQGVAQQLILDHRGIAHRHLRRARDRRRAARQDRIEVRKRVVDGEVRPELRPRAGAD